MFAARLMFLRIAAVASCLLLVACGSGGGGDSSTTAAPYIFGGVLSFPETNVPPAGFVPTGFNSEASVTVLDSTTGEPITNASVSVNGIPLAYVPASQEYERGISISPGSRITLNVTVGSTTYTSTATQFSAYPAITSPLTDATWVSTESNLAAWSGVAPTASSLYALGIFDTNGELIWPLGGSIQFLPTTTTSYTLSPWSLTAGERLLIVGLIDLVGIPNAHPDSGLIIGGFNHVPITVVDTRPARLLSIAVTPDNPTVTVGKTKQLTATGSYSDGSNQDMTAQVTWQSSDPTKATVSATGLVAGQSYGSTTVTATFGGISGATLVNVFQPTPSPAPPLSQSVTYQIDYAHSGRAVFPYSITFPSNPAWSVALNGAISYPLIADGKIYVTTANPDTGGGSGGTSLYALDEQTGDVVWGPVMISGGYRWSASAYDHGKIFVINFDGLLRSFDAATGDPGWSKQLPGNQYWFDSPPTAVNGIVYVGGSGSGGTLYAVDETNGNVLWTAGVANGQQSSPAVSSDGVFVSYPCQVYKFEPITGESLWHYSGPCQGGGGETSAYANGLLYVRDTILSQINNPPSPEPPGRIYDATTGTQVGTFNADPIPALGTATGFFLNGGALQAVNLVSHTVLWSFAGDGELVSAPIIINQVAIVGSRSGNVYAIDAGTGLEIWSRGAGSAIAGSFEGGLNQPPTGLGAGEGYLVVPAGNVLTAWKLFGP
jgi:outer membrane protein assembly factor BamB